MLNGIVVLNKERGMTSSDCVYKLRKLLHIRKIGHAGTLDPEVNGVLPIAIGQATKLIELMHEEPKAYIGTGRFGLATDSYDLEGKVLETKAVEKPFTRDEISSGMEKLTGELEQVPPIYSAVRVNGMRLYEYARKNIPVERPKRKVEVFNYQLTNELRYDKEHKTQDFDFAIKCSKGTYVRSLVNDLGSQLNMPAVMTSLTRIASSGFNINHAVSLADIEKNLDHPEKWLQAIDDFFSDYPTIDLTQDQFNRVKNGAAIKLNIPSEKVALRFNNKIKAIYKKVGQDYRPDLMLLKNE